MLEKTRFYQPHIAQKMENELEECAAVQAQPYCNFVVFELSTLPEFKLIKQQLRKESERHPASFRIELTYQDKPLSIKQFLYDWAPPAYDYPCLWLNTKKFKASDFPAPRPIVIENNVLWIGKNYRGQNAATIDVERTRVEITFEGIINDELLVSLIQALKPCDDNSRKQILNTPFSYLSYFYRHKKKASDVPISYWKHLRFSDCDMVVVPQEDNQSKAWLPQALVHALYQAGYYFNSQFNFNNIHETIEKEYLFEHHAHPGVFIHCIVMPSDAPNAIHFPPHIGDQVCVHHQVTVAGNACYLAFAEYPLSNYEFVYQKEGFIYLVLFRAASWVTKEWTINLIENGQMNL